MIKFINKVIISLCLIFIITSCDIVSNSNNNGKSDKIDTIEMSYEYSGMKTDYIDTISQIQLDSVIFKDGLPMIHEWSEYTFADYETRTTVTKHIYMYNVGDGSQLLYVVTNQNEPYIIEKRIMK